MERRVRGNSHARCGVGENPEIASKDYLSLFTPAMGMPSWIPYGLMLASSVVSLFYLIGHLLEDLGIPLFTNHEDENTGGDQAC